MTHPTILEKVSTVPAADAPVSETRPENDPLREITEVVKNDCRLAPEEYLQHTRVPVGGE